MADGSKEGLEKLGTRPDDVSSGSEDSVDIAKISFFDDKKGAITAHGDNSAIEARIILGQKSDADPMEQRIQLKVTPRRWIVLAAVALLNNSNTILWIAFAAVANHADTYYGVHKAANWFSLIYIICTIPVGIFAMWMGSRFGLRTALLIAAGLNGGGSVIRFLSSFLPQALRFPFGIFGQGVAACAYPFIMFLPTKVAGSWFADNERTMATTIAVMANPAGVLIANLISPHIITKPDDVPLMNGIVMIPPLVTCLVVIFGVTTSAPKVPPTIGAATEQMDFVSGVKACAKNKAYIVLMITLGGGIGMFNTLYTVMQQLLCPSGYSNTFSGISAAIMIGGGILGAAVAGMFVDRTKLYEETMKIAFAFAVVSGLVFLQLTLRTELAMLIGITSFLFGVFGLAAYPVGLELSAECTFPVPENVSSGLIVICGQIQAMLFVALFNLAARPLQEQYKSRETCSHGGDVKAMDNTYPIIGFSIVAGSLALLMILLFRPTLKRLTAEQTNGRSIKDEHGQLLNDNEIRLATLNRSSEPLKENVEIA